MICWQVSYFFFFVSFRLIAKVRLMSRECLSLLVWNIERYFNGFFNKMCHRGLEDVAKHACLSHPLQLPYCRMASLFFRVPEVINVSVRSEFDRPIDVRKFSNSVESEHSHSINSSTICSIASTKPFSKLNIQSWMPDNLEMYFNWSCPRAKWDTQKLLACSLNLVHIWIDKELIVYL